MLVNGENRFVHFYSWTQTLWISIACVCVCSGYVMEWKFTCHKLLPKKLSYGIKFNLIEIVEEREDEIYILNVIS